MEWRRGAECEAVGRLDQNIFLSIYSVLREKTAKIYRVFKILKSNHSSDIAIVHSS